MNNGLSIVSEILDVLWNMGSVLPLPFETPYQHVKRMRRIERYGYGHTVWKMQKRGIVKIAEKNGKKFLKITKKGQLQLLLEKAQVNRKQTWDRKWRLIIFDIPESSREKRSIFRTLLKTNNFYKLQASVYISPYPLNRDAVTFLKKSGLIDYIRILRVDDMDNDKVLKRKFNLR